MVPAVWKHFLVIPIAKPGKDPSKATSYRPIALTCNMCKLMESTGQQVNILYGKQGAVTRVGLGRGGLLWMP